MPPRVTCMPMSPGRTSTPTRTETSTSGFQWMMKRQERNAAESRWMSKPDREDQGNVARIGKYLNGGFCFVEHDFPFLRGDRVVRAYADSVCAVVSGLAHRRAEECWAVGGCTGKHQSSTQKAIALSSTEAKLSAEMMAHSEANVVLPLGHLHVRAFFGAHATMGITHCRLGEGPAAYLITQALDTGRTRASRVRAWHNPADVAIGPVSQETLLRHLGTLGSRIEHPQSRAKGAVSEGVRVCGRRHHGAAMSSTLTLAFVAVLAQWLSCDIRCRMPQEYHGRKCACRLCVWGRSLYRNDAPLCSVACVCGVPMFRRSDLWPGHPQMVRHTQAHTRGPMRVLPPRCPSCQSVACSATCASRFEAALFACSSSAFQGDPHGDSRGAKPPCCF